MKTLFLTLTTVLAITISSQAQELNDDLAPKKVTATKARTIKTGKSTRNTTRRKNPPRTGSNYTPLKNRTPQRNPLPPSNPVVNTFVSSDQIIGRYMNYDQSSTVTYKDWESVIKQSSMNPNDVKSKAQGLIAQGELAYSRNDYSNALVNFNSAAQVMPNSVLPHYGIGKVYLATRQPNEAEKYFEKTIKLDKNFALGHKGIGDALTAQGKAKKAQEHYETASKLRLAAGGRVMQSPTPQNNQMNKVAETSKKNIQPTPLNNQSSPYQNELRTARALTARKKYQESLNKLTPLSQSSPNADIFMAMGDNYVGLEQMLSAQQAYLKASQFNPNSALAFYKLGSMMMELGEFKGAADSFEKSLMLDQRGATINRRDARRMADRASQKAKTPKGKVNIPFI